MHDERDRAGRRGDGAADRVRRTTTGTGGRGAPVVALAVAAALSAATMAGCLGGDDGGSGGAAPPAPRVTALGATQVAVGDTLRITGADFATPASRNTVRFANALGTAVPFAGTATRLDVVVPPDAASGPVSVVAQGNPTPGVGPSVEVVRGVGEVWLFQPLAAGQGASFAQPGASSRMLVVPHATNPAQPYTAVFSYTLSADTSASAIPATPGRGSASAARGTLTLREAFEAHRWRAARRLPRRAVARPRVGRSARAGAPGDTAQFYVLNTTTASPALPSSFTRVTAIRRMTGVHCILYTDVDTLPTGNFTATDLRSFVDTFDMTIHPSNTSHFGPESDIDGNGRVIILVTPVVNRLTPPGSNGFIGGFFLANDLYAAGSGGVPAGTTNHAEIFYVLASDPSATWGNTFARAFAAAEDLRTIAHEFQHLISFSQRLFHYGGAFQQTWLEEGMAHMAEDFAGMNQSNVNRAKLYLQDPGAVSLEHNQAPLEQRGGIYLFLRWLADRFGDTITAQIVQSNLTGRASIEAITGEDFYRTVGDFFAALYLSGRGINTSSRFNFSSIDPASIQAIPVGTLGAGGSPAGGSLVRASADFYLVDNALSAATRMTLTGSPSGGRLRMIVVRTQ